MTYVDMSCSLIHSRGRTQINTHIIINIKTDNRLDEGHKSHKQQPGQEGHQQVSFKLQSYNTSYLCLYNTYQILPPSK